MYSVIKAAEMEKEMEKSSVISNILIIKHIPSRSTRGPCHTQAARWLHEALHAPGPRSAAAWPLVWGAAPATACGWGATPPCCVAHAWVNSAPKNTIRAE
jgi:hypothetical protein